MMFVLKAAVFHMRSKSAWQYLLAVFPNLPGHIIDGGFFICDVSSKNAWRFCKLKNVKCYATSWLKFVVL